MMTVEAYRAKMKAEEDWAPGWDAIDEAFDLLYPGQEPQHFGTLLTSRAMFGGEEYLDGYSVYESPNGYKHLLTYGMSELYTNEESFGGEWSKWGYEMTIKLKEETVEDCRWAISMLGNLARYTFTSKRFFEPYQYVGGDGSSLNLDKPELKISGLLILPDTEAEGRETVHGRLDFLQLVGLTANEVKMIQEDPAKPAKAQELARRLKEDYPHLETDMYRTKEYLF